MDRLNEIAALNDLRNITGGTLQAGEDWVCPALQIIRGDGTVELSAHWIDLVAHYNGNGIAHYIVTTVGGTYSGRDYTIAFDGPLDTTQDVARYIKHELWRVGSRHTFPTPVCTG